MVASQAAFVVAEDHVHDPVQAVLHRPVIADDGAEPVGGQGQRGDVDAGLGPAGPAAQFAAALEHDDGVQPGPVVALAEPGRVVEDGDLAGLDASVIAVDPGAAADGGVSETIGFLLGYKDLDVVAQRALVALQRENVVGAAPSMASRSSSLGIATISLVLSATLT